MRQPQDLASERVSAGTGEPVSHLRAVEIRQFGAARQGHGIAQGVRLVRRAVPEQVEVPGQFGGAVPNVRGQEAIGLQVAQATALEPSDTRTTGKGRRALGSSAMTEPTHLHATRVAYDTVAENYAKLVPPMFEDDLYGRAMISTFAELTRALDAGPVADLGCGPGHVTAHVQSLGVTAFGIDLSPETVAVARRRHPELRFDEGSMTDLDLADGSLGGVIAWYSIVHTPPELLPVVFAEFHRVLAPGGHLLIAFKAGDRLRHVENAYGHDVSLDVYWISPDRIAELLSQTGLMVDARLIREPNEQERPRQGQQAYLLARKPAKPEQKIADTIV